MEQLGKNITRGVGKEYFIGYLHGDKKRSCCIIAACGGGEKINMIEVGNQHTKMLHNML